MHPSIQRLLIANRGEIARRVIRTAQAMGLATVAVYSDADAQGLHVREADQAYRLGPAPSADSYLNMARLLAAARATGADAVHPGYGFLSENADFAQAVLDAGLVWVGPPPAAIRALGSKAQAKQLALAHGVPVLPGYQGDDQSDARFAAEAQRIGFPLMVKATAGGGGRGMRWVESAEQLAAALAGARSEALSSFGSAELLIERALRQPRHVEVQVFADAHGQVIHLGERDCSVQRRHQKIIEESPSPAVDAALRERLGAAAVALAQAAGYVGAGTVEFLLDGGHFYLMEMNTRLQVEHPVTEMLTGLDLVEWQLRVARGEPLPLSQDQVRWQGHAIEVRLCAEDEAFVPQTGMVQHLREPAPRPGLRFDHALQPGLCVTPHYDAMLGKLIAHGADRSDAIRKLALALDQLQLLGLASNRALLAACLRHPVFVHGQALIPFLAEQGAVLRQSLQATELAQLPKMMASLWPRTTELPCPYPRRARVRHRGLLQEVEAVAVDQPAGASPLAMDLQAVPLPGRRWHLQHQGCDLFVDDASFDPPAATVLAQAQWALRAPMNGRVLAVPVVAGQALAQGGVLLVLESMKLEHSLLAPRALVVQELLVAAGQSVAAGQLLMRFEQEPA